MTMIKQCPIIWIKKHVIYIGRTNAKLLKDLHDLQSLEYVVDSAMCYAKLKIMVEKTAAETCINKLRKTRNVQAAFKKLQVTFLGPGFTQQCTRQLEEELCYLWYMGKPKHNNL